MKTSQLLNILLAVALVVLSIKIVRDNGSKDESDTVSGRAAMENIMTRTSIRVYQDKPVSEETIEQLLRAAMSAPSARNQQPWRFIVIKDKNTLKAISEKFDNIKMATKAPLAIVVCGDKKATSPGEGAEYWVQDASAATENLLLAAHSLGLGAVWCGIYPIQERVGQLKELLNIPDDIVPLNVVPIGYAAEDPAPKDKWKPEEIHYESWTGTPPTK